MKHSLRKPVRDLQFATDVLSSPRRLIALFFQVRPGDPAVLGAAAAALLAVGVMTSWSPARRVA